MILKPLLSAANVFATLEDKDFGVSLLKISGVTAAPGGNAKGVKLNFKRPDGSDIPGLEEIAVEPQLSDPTRVIFELRSDFTDPLCHDNSSIFKLTADGLGTINVQRKTELRASDTRSKGGKAADARLQSQAEEASRAQAAAQANANPDAAAGAAPAAAPKKGISGLIVKIIIGILVLLLIAAAAFWVLRNLSGLLSSFGAGAPQAQSEEEASEQESEHQPQDEAANQGACALASSKDDAELLKNCLGSNPSNDELMALAKESFSSQRCDVGLRLLTSLGRSKTPGFALYYAKLADPNSRDETACIKKDAKSAAYWYQKAIDAGDSEEAQQALEKLK